MSRPGFVFDCATAEGAGAEAFTCRGCGEVVKRSEGAELHTHVKLHVRERHALANADAWKVTQHERDGRPSIVCLWPPEAF